MQPISLKLENFGPYENTLIDFSSFYAQSLFLITGKTGAGKTTIFDGMCFALYGKTSGGLREGKEMRSNFAEIGQQTRVIFTFKQGEKTYEVSREPEQLVKKQRGEGFREKPAEVSLTIFDANQNEINQLTKQKDVGIFLGDLIQLNEQQFSQIVMLPQGEFRRFLNADSDSKEKVLRKLFNTYFYQDLAELLRQKKKSKENLLKDVKKELEVLVTQIKWQDDFKSELEEDMYYQDVLAIYEKQAESYAKELRENELDLKRIHENQEKLQVRIQKETKWLDSFEELAEKEEQKRNQASIEESIREDKKQMVLLQKIEKISPTYQQLKTAEHEYDENVQKEASLIGKQKEILDLLSTQQKNYDMIISKEAEVNLSLEKIKEMTTSEPFFEKQKNLIEKEKQTNQQLSDLKLKESAIQIESEELASQINEWQFLISNQLSLNEEKNILEKEQQQKETRLLEIKNYFELKANFSKKEKEITDSQNQLADKQKDYEKSLNIFKQSKSNWAKAQIAKLSLDLVSGEPCPVCGSIEHPAPSHGESMTKEELTQLERSVDEGELATISLRENIVSIEKTLEFFVSDSQKIEAQVLIAEQSITNYFNNEVNSSHWLETLEKEKELVELALTENKKKLVALEKTKIDLAEGLTKKEHLTEQLTDITEQLKVAEHESIQLTTELKNLRENLPDTWTTLAEMLAEKNKLITETSEWQESFNQVKEIIEDLTKEKLVTETTLKNVTEQQVNIIEKVNIAKKIIEEFIQTNQLDIEEIANLVEQLAKLPELVTKIQNFEKEDYLLIKELARLTEMLKDKVKPDMEPLFNEKQVLANEEVDKQKYIATISYEIKENNALIQNIQTKELAMKQDLDELEELAELTNVMTGDGPHKLSMERFVLQTYLKRILQRANEKLVVLTNGRYRFELKEEQASFKKKTGLEINIFDDNVGSLRSVNTLSGGESFIAALSLALSLAEVIQEESGGIQIDAMFIDEGFGSLDEDALEMAIRALENIEGDGRLIGIISHVRELKERIPQQLAVQSTLDGKSYVTERLEFE